MCRSRSLRSRRSGRFQVGGLLVRAVSGHRACLKEYWIVSHPNDPLAEREWQQVADALAAAGVDPTDFGRFTSGRHPDVIRQPRFDFDAAVPVLVDWLPRVTTRAVKEAVVRSLSVPAARPRAQLPLIEAFERESDPMVKWAIANALDAIADEKLRPELLRLA